MSGGGWLEVNCPEHRCGATVGEQCRNINTGAPLHRRPAHEKRLWNAEALGLWEPTPYFDHGDDPWAVTT